MEFEDLKNTWSTLDDRLKKQETLHENIIRKMMYEKTDKSKSKLFNYSLLGIVLYMGAVIFLSYQLHMFRILAEHHKIEHSLFMQIIMILFIVGFIISSVFAIHNLFLLNKINIKLPLKKNIEYLQEYKIKSKRLIMSIYAVFIPIFVILIIGMQYYGLLGASQWALIIFLVLGGTIYSIWEYKKLYKKNIYIIQESLKELKELKED